MSEEKFKAKDIINKIQSCGFEAYYVGGCVRDYIMGKECHDIDITTNAEPFQILKIFSNYKTVETGIKHGTVTVISNNGSAVEVTTYRKESGYIDNRHPENVSFCKNISDDLSRRDFTFNAIAFNFQSGLTDLYGGFSDISSKTVKCIGTAEERFNEDALRILRALRFAATFGFKIEKSTSSAIHKLKDLLFNISSERVASELIKMLCSQNFKNIFLEYYDVFEVILPELSGMKNFNQHNFHHKYDVLEHTAVVVESTEPLPHLRLAALFHDCGKPECFSIDENGVGHFYSHASVSAKKAEAAMKRLKFDNKTAEQVVKLVKIHDSPIEEDERVIKRKLNKYGEQTLKDLIKLQYADTMGLADEFKCRIIHFENLKKLIDNVLSENECFCIKSLDVNGYDIINLGYQGKQVGEILKYLVEAVIDKKVQNQKNDLINFIRENKTANK